MKLLRPPSGRVDAKDSLGQGMDAVITLVLFGAIGFGLDQWLDTLPWLTIAFVVVASVGVFYKLKLGYEAKMAEHEAQRVASRAPRVAPHEEAAP